MQKHAVHKNDQRQQIIANNHFNIVEILKLDHSYLKECIEVLTDEDENKKAKYKHAKGFLDALKKHSLAEKKVVYSPLEKVEEFRGRILESEIEHGIVDAKVKSLIPKIAAMRLLNDEMEAEMKVLADIVLHHVEEEEDELLPQMTEEISSEILNEMGYQFMLLRQFTDKDLLDVPELKEEASFIKKTPPMPMAKFLSTSHEYFSGSEFR